MKHEVSSKQREREGVGRVLEQVGTTDYEEAFAEQTGDWLRPQGVEGKASRPLAKAVGKRERGRRVRVGGRADRGVPIPEEDERIASPPLERL